MIEFFKKLFGTSTPATSKFVEMPQELNSFETDNVIQGLRREAEKKALEEKIVEMDFSIYEKRLKINQVQRQIALEEEQAQKLAIQRKKDEDEKDGKGSRDIGKEEF